MNTGEQHAWKKLTSLASDDVCSRTGAIFNRDSETYSLDLFDQRVDVSPGSCEIIGHTPQAEHLLTALSHFSRLSVLGFLIHAQDIHLSGRLVKPGELPGVDAMVRGSHTLPLDELSARYAENIEELLPRGQAYGGIPQDHGDASLLLHPFKALPVVLILWSGDEEFPARSDLLLDASSRYQAPPDILWCVMMLTVLAML